MQPGNARGRDVPRPYVLSVPGDGGRAYAPGDTLEFGLTTFGQALNKFPYALIGVEEMGRGGVGLGRQGTFRLEEIWAENPLAGRQNAVYQRARGATVRPPALPVTASDVADEATRLGAAGGNQLLTLELRSPTRLVEREHLVKPATFTFRALLGRLLERLTALRDHAPDSGSPFDASALLEAATALQVTNNQLVWRELFRGSSRHRRMLPMGGLVGSVTVGGDLAPFLPWLVWGTLTHVGKDAAMGNGQFRLELPA